VHIKAVLIAQELTKLGCTQLNKTYFDTVKIQLPEGFSVETLKLLAETNLVNFRYFEDGTIGISTDETTSTEQIAKVVAIFAQILGKAMPSTLGEISTISIPANLIRQTPALNHDIFEKYHSETEMMRYIKRLDRKIFHLRSQ